MSEQPVLHIDRSASKARLSTDRGRYCSTRGLFSQSQLPHAAAAQATLLLVWMNTHCNACERALTATNQPNRNDLLCADCIWQSALYALLLLVPGAISLLSAQPHRKMQNLCDRAVLKALLEEHTGCANSRNAVRNREQHGSSYPGVELMARCLHLHELQHPIPETYQGRAISSADGHFLELDVRRRQLVGLVVAAGAAPLGGRCAPCASALAHGDTRLGVGPCAGIWPPDGANSGSVEEQSRSVRSLPGRNGSPSLPLSTSC